MKVAGPVPRDLEDFHEYARSWLNEQEIPEVPEDLDERFDSLRRWQGLLYEAGFIGISWPENWGGQGLSVYHQQVFTDELIQARAPQPIGLIGLDVVGPSVARYAQPALRDRLMPAMLSGEQIWCQGFSEPAAGSDLAGLSTTGVLEGEDLVVTGQKTWTSWAHKADWCALLVRTAVESTRHQGISYLIVDMASSGITVRPIRQMTGESEFCEVFFEGVRVPVSQVMGELNEGWAIALDTLSLERGSYTVRRRAEINAPFDDAVVQLALHFAAAGETPPDRIAELIGRSAVSLAALRGQTRATLARLAADQAPDAMDSVDKLVLSEIEQNVFGGLKNLLGHRIGLSDGTHLGLRAAPIARDYLYGRAASIYGGSSQIQLNIVAERLLGLPR